MNKKLKILFYCMIFVGGAAFSQKMPAKKGGNMLFPSVANTQWTLFLLKQKAPPTVNAKTILPPDFYAKQLGFFCKQEIKMDKAVRIPFRFRLGSVEQCSWLEGKKR